ncbi:hypothetical protein KR074_003586, partial [Drosophila pseudoananassae]
MDPAATSRASDAGHSVLLVRRHDRASLDIWRSMQVEDFCSQSNWQHPRGQLCFTVGSCVYAGQPCGLCNARFNPTTARAGSALVERPRLVAGTRRSLAQGNSY